MDIEKLGLVEVSLNCIKPGDVFGRLTVLAVARPKTNYRYVAICSCSCGAVTKKIRVDALRSGATVSCGCYHSEVISTHGQTKSPLFNSWRSMMERCYNKNSKSFHRYGGRGITVCKMWHDVVNFVNDMQGGYKKGLQLDRIDNDGDYCKENCRWASRTIQCRNRSTNINIDICGEVKTLTEWCEINGVNVGTAWSRIHDNGWSPIAAVTTSPISVDERMAIARKARWG